MIFLNRLNSKDNNLYRIISDFEIESNQIINENSKQNNTIMIPEEEWNSIEEILYLSNIREEIDKIRENEDWDRAIEYNKDKDW